MNLKAAYDTSASATAALDHALSQAQLLLSRKKKERAERAKGYKAIIEIMEAELEAGDREIADLEKIVFGEPPKAEPNPPSEGETETHLLPASKLMLNGHAQEAAE